MRLNLQVKTQKNIPCDCFRSASLIDVRARGKRPRFVSGKAKGHMGRTQLETYDLCWNIDNRDTRGLPGDKDTIRTRRHGIHQLCR